MLNDPAAVCRRPRPQDDLQCFAGLPTAPPAALLSALALGRRAAAADFVWLRTLQFIGADHAEQVRYAGLSGWVERVVELKPEFTDPAYLSATLLSTVPSRAAETLRLLSLAEPSFAGTKRHWQIYFWRATVHEYVLQDVDAARQAYRKAGELGGPLWLSERAQTLEQETLNCGSVRRRLMQTFAEANRADSALQLQGQRANTTLREILENCHRQHIRRAEAAFVLEHQRVPKTIQELVDAGRLEAPSAPPGMKWVLIKRIPQLVPLAPRSAP